MDFDSLEKLFSEQKPRLMFLCNPHNPVGRVWTREELQVLGELCKKYQVVLVSDDIHADLVFPGHRYQPLISISETLKNNAIQMMSPGKSFNIPGLCFSYALIADKDLREHFSEKLSALALAKTNIMAAVASQAAYQNGAQWLDRVLEYIRHNHVLLKTTLSSELPWAKVIPLEGTFLAWVDLNASGLDHNQLSQVVRSRAKLMLFEGTVFGDAGRGFMRINLACPRKTMQEAIKRLVNALVQTKENPPEAIKILENPSTTCKCCS
jgi:cystathionine beta-lyase